MTDQLKVNVYDPEVAQIIELLQAWHAKRVQQLQMIVQAPADAELVLRGANGHQVLLVGAERKGFKAGVATSLEFFGKFPLTVAEINGDDADAEEE